MVAVMRDAGAGSDESGFTSNLPQALEGEKKKKNSFLKRMSISGLFWDYIIFLSVRAAL